MDKLKQPALLKTSPAIPNENKIRIAPDSPGGGKIFFRNIAEQQVKWSGGIRKCLEIEAEDMNVDPRVDRKSLGV